MRRQPPNRALGLAIEIAVKHEATLDIIYVIRDLQLPDKLRGMAEMENMAGARGEFLMFVAEQILGDARERAKENGVSAVRTHAGKGDPAGAIIAHAKRRQVDLIVLGTRGLSKTEGLLLGSVSRKVANLCKMNCLIAH